MKCILNLVVAICISVFVSAQEKAGVCPKPQNSIGICRFDPRKNCKGDEVCPGDQKCCSDGCNKICRHPSNTTSLEKSGTCPTPSGLAGICRFEPDKNCLGDEACPNDQKCCSDGCNKSCQDPAPLNDKSWSCPKFEIITNPCGSIPVRNCNGDDSCAGDQKCCSDGCRSNCYNKDGSLAQSLEKPGICPKINETINSCGFLPVRNCSGDDACPGNQKCCTDGCDYNCKSPE